MLEKNAKGPENVNPMPEGRVRIEGTVMVMYKCPWARSRPAIRGRV